MRFCNDSGSYVLLGYSGRDFTEVIDDLRRGVDGTRGGRAVVIVAADRWRVRKVRALSEFSMVRPFRCRRVDVPIGLCDDIRDRRTRL